MKIILIATLLFTSFMQAQNYTEILGKVLDDNGKSISGATITINELSLEELSDENGFFKLENIAPKTYNISASAIGYETETKFNVIIKSAGNSDIIFNLKAVSNLLDEVKIVSNPFKRKKESPLSIQSLSPVEIASYPGGNNDIAKVVQTLPGVSGSVGGFRNDIIIRGGAPNENVYYLDAIEIPNINHFSTQGSAGGPVGLLNVSFIEGVTLSSSAFESKYNNPLSGVLQFNQRNGNNKKFQGNLRIGASEAAITAEGPLFKGKNETSNTTYLLSVRRSYLQFLFTLIGLPIRPDFWDYQYKINSKLDAYNEINFLGVGAIDDFSVKAPDDFDIQQQITLDQVPVIKQWSTTSGLSWRRRFKDESGFMINSISTNILNNNFQRFTDNENEQGLFFSNNSRETEVKFRNEVTKNIGDWKIVAGFNVENALYTNDTQNIINNENYSTDINFVKSGFFAQSSTTILNDNLDVSFGFRVDANSFTTQKNQLLRTFSPRLALSYALTAEKDWKLNAAVGKYFKIQPYTILGYKDNLGNFANKDADYTSNIHYVIGLSKILNPTTQITIEGFFKDYKNYAVSIDDGVSLANKGGDFEVLGNEDVITNGLGRSYGLEFLYQQKLTKNFFGIFAYTLFKSEFTGLDNQYRPSVWDSRNLVSVTAGYKFKRNWEAGMRYRYGGKTPFAKVNEAETLENYPQVVLDFTNLGEQKLNAFNQLDLRIDKKWNFKKFAFNLFLDVQNALGQIIPQPIEFGLNRDQNGQIINPRSLLGIDAAEGTVIPSLGIILDF
ncbi:TonB-dependent Receptor Plug Domain [Flavobacterium fryxellicola]|uniref:TonB-dependent receptor n=1 Tax=Flavobacterium fryxellicola TaxID=249352 RepID=A0A167V9T7_9FLAO|nr:TonB-dependent receptor [Flavobacterium fryxellicola]OAB26205.1 TonB-dependent receptor [Flavobacterium fryxellicola]SHN79538.1 TonB-dependent Receptor Plug Domain [Flavobacterium fryxellicola]